MVLFWKYMEPRPGVYNRTTFSVLDTAIRRAKIAGLYVIVDPIHLYGGLSDTVPSWAIAGDSVSSIQTNGGEYLAYVASRYRNESNIAGYDLVNEPARWPLDQNAVLRMYQALIVRVRSIDRNTILFIEPTYGETSIAGPLADFSIITDKANLVYSLHDYFAGGSSDGYDSSTGGPVGTYVFDGNTGYSVPNRASLENHLLVSLTKLRSAGIPMWIGEFGIGDGVVNHDLWINDKVALYRQYGLSWTWWEYNVAGPLSATYPDYTWKPWVQLIVR